MKADKLYSLVYFCPVNGDMVNMKIALETHRCNSCEQVLPIPETHLTELQGKWYRPTIWEWLNGERAIFKSVALIKEEVK